MTLTLLLTISSGTALSAVAGEPPGRLPDVVQLPGKTRGEAAIRALGNKLAAVAADHGMKEEHLRHELTHDKDLWVETTGRLVYSCEGLVAPDVQLPAEPAPQTAEPPVAAASVPISSPPIYHSRPGAPNSIYLDFNGGLVSGTAWGGPFDCYAFSADSDYDNFSDAEQLTIKRTWQRIAEDYAPYNVDVTTEEPTSGKIGVIMFTRNLCKGGNNTPAAGYGGIAYVGTFGNSYYWPAWVSTDGVGTGDSNMAAAGSHEMGHNMGLSHDGLSTTTYYNGHGTGDISWGPIMGSGYYSNVTQFSKGEYYDANQTQDDLAIIAGKVPYLADDCGNTNATAKALTVVGTAITSTTPENDPANANPANKGIIERNTDVDVWSFSTGAGSITLNVNPWISATGKRGGNLDVRLELYDSGGALVATANPASTTYASIATTVAQGTYYLHVKPTGTGTPLANPPSGYTVYGSLGQYFISGTVVDALNRPVVSIAAPVPNASEAGPTAGRFTLTRTGATTTALTVGVSIGGTATNGSDYSSLTTSYTIPVGATSLDIPVTPINDTAIESNETVIMTIAVGAAYTGSGSATVTITSDDSYASGPGKGITREWWTGITGTAVTALTGNAAYPNTPTGSVLVTTLFEAPTNFADNYGTRMHGYFIPPATGAYTFYIASDDSSELWLSTNTDPANIVKIAYLSGYTSSRNWTANATQKSAPINLVAGSRYYIRALQKEGGGSDNLAVGVDLPAGVSERPIPGHRLDPWSSLTYTLTASAGTGGAITPSGTVTVNSGASQTFTITPNAGYSIADVKVDGASVGKVASYTFTNVTANHTIAATFSINTYTLIASAGAGGTIAPSGTITVNSGASQTFTISPNAGYGIADVKVDGASVGKVASYTFTNVTANHTIAATFSINTYTLTASAGAGGAITPSGTVTVNSGASQTFTITPNAGYGIADVKVDGASVGKVGSYTFTNVTANHTIAATFSIINVAPAAPTNLVASAVSSTQINLTWTDNANNEAGFKIERKTGAAGTWAQIATTAANVTSYSNTGLASNTTYVYRVRATNAVGDSGYSNEASATTGGGVIGNGNGLRGEYFGDKVLSTSLLTRIDPTVNFDWGTGSPATNVPVNGFSARWTGQIQAQYTQTYTIATQSDDGVRLWIGGNQIVNNWTDHSPTENSGTIALVAGQKYNIRMEYYENGGGAVAKLLWSSPSTAKQVVPKSQLYAAPVGPPGYIYCANENQTYTLTGTCDVAYGANGKFYYLLGRTGSIAFNNATFGDPIVGTFKAGFFKVSGTTTNAAPVADVEWSSKDIGGVAKAGRFEQNDGTFVVTGSGADIGGLSDEYHFVYRPMSGDGTITARVNSLENTDPWAKAGVMLRQSLDANSGHVSAFVTPGGTCMERRNYRSDGSQLTGRDANCMTPGWVRIVRTGNNFKCYKSNDGLNWKLIGQVNLAWSADVYVGLAVTSHKDGKLTTASFTQVNVQP